jgi:hypothetical protein
MEIQRVLAFHDLREDPVPFHHQKDSSSTPRGVQARLDITEGNHLKISCVFQKHNINLSNHPDGQRNYVVSNRKCGRSSTYPVL